MKLSALFSGGKDSVYAVYWAINNAWDVNSLVSILPKSNESWMFHYPNIKLTKLQAEAMDMPIITQESSGEKDIELNDLTKLLKRAKEEFEIDGIVSGAIASEYQKTNIETVCHKLKLKSFVPLWHKNQTELLQHMVSAGFDIIISSVSADGLDEPWLGRHINKETIEELDKMNKTNGLWQAGEGGEFETFVVDGPIFKKKLTIDKYETNWGHGSGQLVIKSAHLEEK